MKFFAATQKFQRVQSRLALFLALVLVTHSLDVCAAHTGIPSLSSAPLNFSVTHGDARCSAPPGVACLCADCACVPVPLEDHHDDGCSAASELSTRAQSISFHFDAPQIAVSCLALPAVKVELPDVASRFLGGLDPPPVRLRSQYYCSPLAGRAPPVSL